MITNIQNTSGIKLQKTKLLINSLQNANRVKRFNTLAKSGNLSALQQELTQEIFNDLSDDQVLSLFNKCSTQESVSLEVCEFLSKKIDSSIRSSAEKNNLKNQALIQLYQNGTYIHWNKWSISDLEISEYLAEKNKIDQLRINELVGGCSQNVVKSLILDLQIIDTNIFSTGRLGGFAVEELAKKSVILPGLNFSKEQLIKTDETTGYTALHWSFNLDKADFISLLDYYDNHNIDVFSLKNKFGANLVHNLIKNNKVEHLEILKSRYSLSEVMQSSSLKSHLLHLAVGQQQSQSVTWLLENNVNTSLTNQMGLDALWLSIRFFKKSPSIFYTVLNSMNAQQIQALSQNIKTRKSVRSHLELAFNFCDIKAIKTLIDKGFDLSEIDFDKAFEQCVKGAKEQVKQKTKFLEENKNLITQKQPNKTMADVYKESNFSYIKKLNSNSLVEIIKHIKKEEQATLIQQSLKSSSFSDIDLALAMCFAVSHQNQEVINTLKPHVSIEKFKDFLKNWSEFWDDSNTVDTSFFKIPSVATIKKKVSQLIIDENADEYLLELMKVKSFFIYNKDIVCQILQSNIQKSVDIFSFEDLVSSFNTILEKMTQKQIVEQEEWVLSVFSLLNKEKKFNYADVKKAFLKTLCIPNILDKLDPVSHKSFLDSDVLLYNFPLLFAEYEKLSTSAEEKIFEDNVKQCLMLEMKKERHLSIIHCSFDASNFGVSELFYDFIKKNISSFKSIDTSKINDDLIFTPKNYTKYHFNKNLDLYTSVISTQDLNEAKREFCLNYFSKNFKRSCGEKTIKRLLDHCLSQCRDSMRQEDYDKIFALLFCSGKFSLLDNLLIKSEINYTHNFQESQKHNILLSFAPFLKNEETLVEALSRVEQHLQVPLNKALGYLLKQDNLSLKGAALVISYIFNLKDESVKMQIVKENVRHLHALLLSGSRNYYSKFENVLQFFDTNGNVDHQKIEKGKENEENPYDFFSRSPHNLVQITSLLIDFCNSTHDSEFINLLSNDKNLASRSIYSFYEKNLVNNNIVNGAESKTGKFKI